MSENLEKKVLIQVDIANQDAQSKMSALQTAILDLSSATEALKSVTQAAKENTSAYSDKIAQSKLNVQQMREETVRLNETRKQETIAIKNAKDATVAASGSYKEAQQSLTKLGNAIKSAKDGFSATSPIIKAQIKEYNELNTKLKEFDKTMGNHQREVGSYKEALSGLEGMLRRLIPGFGEFSEVLKTATSGFNAMKGSAAAASETVAETGVAAQGAEAGMAGMGAAAIGLTAGMAALVAVGVGVFEWFTDVASVSDNLATSWAAAGGAWDGFMNSVRNGDILGLARNMGKAATTAGELKQSLIDLSREEVVSAVEKNKEDQFIATQMLRMRNLHTTSKEAEEIFKEVQKTAQEQFDRISGEAFRGYTVYAAKIQNEAKLTEAQFRELMTRGVAAAKEFKEANEHIRDDSIENFAKFQSMMDSAEGLKNQIDQRAQNREDQKLAKNEKAAAAELARQQKEAAQLAKIKQETESANSERLASIVRTLDFQRQAFAKELSDTDEHYRQLIFKQRKFIEDMQVVVDSKKSTPKEKAAARLGIKAGNNVIGTLTKEQAAAQQSLLEEHSKKILDLSQKAANDLSTLQISAIKDAEERERQTENLQYKEKQEAIQKQLTQFNQDKNRLNNEIKTATGERLAILKKELDDTQTMIDVAHDKQSEEQMQHNIKLKKILQDYVNQRKLLQDQSDIIKTGEFGSSPSRAANFKAQQKELDDNHNINLKKLADGEITANEFLKIDEQYISDSNALKYKAAQDLKQFELKTTQEVARSSFQILESSLQRQTQANDVYLQRQKSHDLSNQALTETQKYQINEKYRILEGKAKVKAFHQQQALDISKATISGALAIVAAEEQPYIAPFVIPGIIITTALSIAEIAAQKAPAYAKGGLHYNSDGKGGVLPGYSKTDNTNAYLRSGEAVVVSEAMRDPWARNLVSAINTSYGGRSFDSTVPVNSWVKPGFAAGGVFNTYLPVGDNGLRPQSQPGNMRFHPDDINSIAVAVSSINFPPVHADIKDFAYQQQRYVKPYDRLNY